MGRFTNGAFDGQTDLVVGFEAYFIYNGDERIRHVYIRITDSK